MATLLSPALACSSARQRDIEHLKSVSSVRIPSHIVCQEAPTNSSKSLARCRLWRRPNVCRSIERLKPCNASNSEFTPSTGANGISGNSNSSRTDDNSATKGNPNVSPKTKDPDVNPEFIRKAQVFDEQMETYMKDAEVNEALYGDTYEEEFGSVWVDEFSEGWGFKYTDMFPNSEPSFLAPEESGEEPTRLNEAVDDELALWLEEEEDFGEVRELSLSCWENLLYGSDVPVLVCVYKKYGQESEASQQQLEEVKKAAKLLYGFAKVPVRVLSVDACTEPQVAKCVCGISVNLDSLVFIKNNVTVFQTSEQAKAEEILQLVGHFLWRAPKNETVDKFLRK